MGKALLVAAIDFAKAFDSVDRGQLIRALMKYKCDHQLIDIIAGLYNGDTTNLYINSSEIGRVEVKSGIRQGCTGSPWLFVMVLNQLIDRIVQSRIGFKNDGFYIPMLFYADDGLLLASSIEDMERMLRMVTMAADDIGMKMNKEKSDILIYGMKEKPQKIEGVNVVNRIRYLGVTVSDTWECFSVYKNDKIQMAQRMSNLTYSVIARSCNKLLIGKTYWKSVVMPSLLFASSAIPWNKTELQKLQRAENSVWRHILGAPGYAPVTAMRGDIGASCMNARDMKTKLKYVRYIMRGSNELLKSVFKDIFNKNKDKLIRIISEYMSDLKFSGMSDFMSINESELERRINEYDEKMWIEEINEKSTLVLYRCFKTNIQEESFYDNTMESSLLFRARSNTLKLGWRKRYENENVKCQLCDLEEETQEHFIEKCPRLRNIRREHEMEGIEMAEILCFTGNRNVEDNKTFLGAMWKNRGRLLKEQEIL